MRERQPYSSFQAIGVSPDKTTDLRLSGGVQMDFEYQLAINSTVPYIRLLGASGGQKLLSWTEKIVVPAGEMVTVQNASFHPGDIWISSGWDPAVLPSRVTVPVQVSNIGGLITPAHPIDTRRAIRAFVQGFPTSPGADFVYSGRAKLRSSSVNQAFSYAPVAVAQYTITISVPPATLPGLLPLGNNAVSGDPVHDLLDEATFTWADPAFQTESGTVEYVLEYR